MTDPDVFVIFKEAVAIACATTAVSKLTEAAIEWWRNRNAKAP